VSDISSVSDSEVLSESGDLTTETIEVEESDDSSSSIVSDISSVSDSEVVSESGDLTTETIVVEES
jgi:hypothetical protein